MHGTHGLSLIDLDLLLRAYAVGLFPMADARDDPEIFWVEPEQRAILPLDKFHMSQSLRKTIRSDRFMVTCNRDFTAVIEACAEAAADRKQTWISHNIQRSYVDLHKRGHAHSIECWQDDRLVGGLYGVEIGRAFCGESMFSRTTDASKVALAHLVAAMRLGGFMLLDCQFMTAHLASLGATEIPQKSYLGLLEHALRGTRFARPKRPRVDYSGAVAGDSADGDSALVAAFSSLLGASAVGPVWPDRSSPSAGFSSPGKLIAQFLTHTS